ncbi:hypothetical protein [Amycolatopsis palatopharyngis]|uniref:hypothetical protein n=1 Tax=Amycolatopsis palatopharyngis TaxID=187982 RepID=UPI000E23C506|nr:hypothetical protein [Amycolatopsis palatopharyngis]
MTDAREALETYEVECRYWNEDHAVWTVEAPKAFAALRDVLDLCDTAESNNRSLVSLPALRTAIQTALGDTTP